MMKQEEFNCLVLEYEAIDCESKEKLFDFDVFIDRNKVEDIQTAKETIREAKTVNYRVRFLNQNTLTNFSRALGADEELPLELVKAKRHYSLDELMDFFEMDFLEQKICFEVQDEGDINVLKRRIVAILKEYENERKKKEEAKKKKEEAKKKKKEAMKKEEEAMKKKEEEEEKEMEERTKRKERQRRRARKSFRAWSAAINAVFLAFFIICAFLKREERAWLAYSCAFSAFNILALCYPFVAFIDKCDECKDIALLPITATLIWSIVMIIIASRNVETGGRFAIVIGTFGLGNVVAEIALACIFGDAFLPLHSTRFSGIY